MQLYKKVFTTGEKLLSDALAALGFDDRPSDPDNLVALNTLGFQRNEVLRLPPLPGVAKYGQLQGGSGISQVKSLDVATSATTASVKEISKGVFVLSNANYDVKITDGVITSLYDKKAKREVIPKGEKANQLVIFDDKPLYWQAWDVEVYHLNSRKELHSTSATTITEHGPHRVAVTTTTTISDKSSIKTTISLSAAVDADTPTYVETEAEVDWHETMKFLKVEFPTTVTNTEASYETQYGIVRRPTHYNTTWDMAKFEVCCHKWADLSEHGYGVSILNDSKYGFATCGNLMRLSLLRAPKAPDAHADMGKHNFRWAILPHKGALDHRTVRTAFAFNNPVKVHTHPSPQDVSALMSAFTLSKDSDDGLIIDTIKRGEDDEDVSRGELPKKKGKNVILRIYDSLGGKAVGKVLFGPIKVAKAWKCNILEDDIEELSVKDGEMEIELRAFEVASYRVLLA